LPESAQEQKINSTKESRQNVFLPLLALWGFGFAQPLFDLVASNNTYLVAHGLLGWPLLIFTASVSLLVPAVCLVLWYLLSPLHNYLRWIPLVAGWGLLCVVLMQFFRVLLETLSPALEFIVAAAVSGLLVWFCKDKTVTRSFLGLAAIGALIFPVLFLVQLPKNYVLQARATADSVLDGAGVSGPLPDIVLVVFDELALTTLLDDNFEIDAARYPNFSSFAAASTWYPQASSAAAGTRVVIPALLSGTTPSLEKSPDAASYPENLFSFVASEYDLQVEEPITKLCSPDVCRQSRDWSLIAIDTLVLLGYVSRLRVVTEHLPPVGAAWIGFLEDWLQSGTDDRIVSLERFIDGLQSSGRPKLDFLHLVLPHVPYTILPSGQKLFRHGPVSGLLIDKHGDRFVDQPWAVMEARELYEWQLRFVDSALGRILGALRQAGRYEEALIVVTADHGVRFTSGQARRGPSDSSYLDIASVPLIVKYPGQTVGRRTEQPIQSTDLLGLIKHVVIEGTEPAEFPASPRRILSSDGWVELPVEFDFGQRENPSRASLEQSLLTPVSEQPPQQPPVACVPARSVELAESQLYAATHPEHFLAAHLVFQIDSDAKPEVAVADKKFVVLFGDDVFAVQKTGPERYSSFVEPTLFKPGFNRVRLLDYRQDVPCVLYDNQIPSE